MPATEKAETRARKLRVVLANPRGFCAGVTRAVSIVERALELFGRPVHVRHEIVHNSHVVDTLRGKGAVFVEDVGEVPDQGVVIFSAHGVSRAVVREAAAKGLDVIDATCPLVHKVHTEGRAFASRGMDVVLVGHAGHPEVEGTRGQIQGRVHIVASVEDVERLSIPDPERVAYVTQTTLSILDTEVIVTALRRRFPAIAGPNARDICYATQNRQLAVLRLAGVVPLVLVVGSRHSSNASRLAEIAVSAGAESHLIDNETQLDPAWLEGRDRIGLTSGASTPEVLVQAVLRRLATLADIEIELLPGEEENMQFKIPPRLTATAASGAAAPEAGAAVI